MQVLKNYNLFIDSSQRDEGSFPSYFSIILRKPITKTKQSSYFRVRIPSLVIPFSFSQVNSKNNVLNYTFNSVSFSITVPSGNYSITDLLTQIQTLIQSNNNCKLLFTYNPSTSITTLGFDTGNLITSQIVMNYSSNNIILMKMMGFTQNVVYSYNAITNAYVNAVGNQVVNVSPSKTLFIRSDTLIQNSNYESLVSRNDTTDILLQIPIMTSFNTYINYNEPSSEMWSEINNSSVDKINLYISDATSNDELPADSGLLNWFCHINIQEIYRDEEINVNHITNPIQQPREDENNNLKVKLIDDLMKQKNDLENEIKDYQNKKSQLK